MLADNPYYSMIVLYLLLTTSFNILDVRATSFVVGDGDGWNLFTNFTNWTEGKLFHVGDILGKFCIQMHMWANNTNFHCFNVYILLAALQF